MCQNSFAFTQASGPSADCITLTHPGSALTNGCIRAEAAQICLVRSQRLPWGRAGHRLRRLPLTPGSKAEPQYQPQVHSWACIGGTSCPLWGSSQTWDIEYVHPGTGLVLVQHNIHLPPSSLFPLPPWQVGASPGTCQEQECGPAPHEAGDGQGRLLVSQDVQLFLALSKEALESKILPNDWQQFLQQLPLPQTL